MMIVIYFKLFYEKENKGSKIFFLKKGKVDIYI